jgi:hypothetical protein
VSFLLFTIHSLYPLKPARGKKFAYISNKIDPIQTPEREVHNMLKISYVLFFSCVLGLWFSKK